jgi:hypothetical protein
LPVGGPASRILAELALNNVDQYLRSSALAFVRYADDYHLFYDSKQEAYLALRTISETLGNEGLVLQRSKTRILTKAEFSAQVASVLGSDEAQPTPARRAYGAIPSVRSIFR